MLLKNIAIINEDFLLEENCNVGIKNGKIDYIGKEMPKESYGEVYEGNNRLAIPAFTNAHAHTPMTLLRGYGENMGLQDWLFQKIFPFEAHLTEEAVYYGTLLGIGEMFRGGTVAATDMYMKGITIIKAFGESGGKVNLSNGTTCFDESSYFDTKDYREFDSLFHDFHMAENGRIRIDASIHGEYTSSPKVVREVAEYAKKCGVRVHLHLSETETEHEECKQRHNGQTPTQYFNDLGLFDVPATAAHCVWVEDDDMDILAEKKVVVGHCPVSNLKLASGVANVPKLLEKGVSVALGTDGVSSNNNLSMIEEMKVFALIHKGMQKNPTVITPKEVFFAATQGGAKSQGREDCGVIKTGNCADIAILRTDVPHMLPKEHLLNHLIYSAGNQDVVATICDGTLVYKDGEWLTIDMEKVMAEVEKHYHAIKQQV